MDKNYIIQEIRKVKTVADFAHLLNDIKMMEFGSSKFPITEKQLMHFCNPKIVPNRYKIFHIAKKHGGQRDIHAPNYQLSIILHILNILFKAIYTPADNVMGFAEGRSVIDNAKVHVGHHYVFNIDLKNFFPSIPQARVWARLQYPPFNFPVEVANVVAGLCCVTNEDGTQNVLPQGAATSPLLTNAICDTLDRKMRGVAKRFGLHYTRYADDMSFSSMHNIYQEGSDFSREISRIIDEQGFTMNDKKTRLFRDGQRQEVTGLTVNSNVNVARKYIKDLRFILHIWEKDGYAKAYSLFYPKYKHDKGYIKKGEPVMENVIDGKLQYLRMVKGASNECYLKLQSRYDRLQVVAYVDSETDYGQNYIYVQPYSIIDFEECFKTSLSFEISSKNKVVGKCVIANMDKIIHVSQSTQKNICPDASKMNEGDVINKNIFSDCFVTLCRQKGKNFWLITKSEPQRSRCLSIQNANINLDNILKIWETEGIKAAIYEFNQNLTNNTSKPNQQKNFENKKMTADAVLDISAEDLKAVMEEIKNSSFDDLKNSDQNKESLFD